MSHTLLLSGLDGSNPLAFLAAMGTLRALTRAQPDTRIRVAWGQAGGAWRPALHAGDLDQAGVLASLVEQCGRTKNHPTLHIADNLTLSIEVFRRHALGQAATSETDATAYVTAFGCEATANDAGRIADTALRTMSGAGHQHFLKTMRDVLATVTDAQIRRALFDAWDYADPLRGLNLRLDPFDDKRYALQWADPSGDATRGTRGNMIGANALAVLGIPLLVVAPIRGELQTTGFRGRRSADCFWTWPIWDGPLSLDVVASLLALAELQEVQPPREHLSRLGIVEIYRSQRITTGKFRNFTPAMPV